MLGISFHALGWAATLEILVDGVATRRREFCVGENVKLVCSWLSVTHVWRSPENFYTQLVFSKYRTYQMGPFIVRLEEYIQDTRIISSLSFNASVSLNGIRVTCDNGRVNRKTVGLTAVIRGKKA